MSGQPTFTDVTERLKVQIEATKALGELKLNTARAELIEAERANLLEVVRAKKLLIRQLERDIQAFERSKRALQAEQRKLASRTRNALFLLSGRRLSASRFSSARASYRLLLQKALPDAGESLINSTIPASARTADNFIPVQANTEPRPAPDTVDNALELVGWMNKQRYVAEVGTAAQAAVIRAFNAINGVARTEADALRTELAGIRAGTLDPWKPTSILLANAPNSAAAKVANAGNRSG